jgi:uncharacterized membrane protein YtjA (UPF0391 family)
MQPAAVAGRGQVPVSSCRAGWHATWISWVEPRRRGPAGPDDDKEDAVLHYSIIFLVVAIIAAVLGFTGIAGAAAGIAKILFIVFLVLFVGSLIFGRRKSV